MMPPTILSRIIDKARQIKMIAAMAFLALRGRPGDLP